MNRLSHQFYVCSDRLFSSAIIALVLSSVTASAAGNAHPRAIKAAPAQKKTTDVARKPKPVAALPDGTVVGTLTLDGKVIKLSHIYARRRETRPMDTERFGLAVDEKLAGGVVEVIITNQPLNETILITILEDGYHGSDRIRGIRLIIDPSGKHSLAHNFLLESGPVAGVGMTQRRGEARIDNRRISGKLECKNEDFTTVRIYSVSFEAPIKLQYSETGAVKSTTSLEQFLKDFQSVLPGKWNIERWIGENGSSNTGTLSVDERLSPEKFRGTFHIVTGNGRNVEEEVTITREGTRVHFEGRVLSDDPWSADILNFELKGGLLVGGGRDKAGTLQDLVLRKIPQ